MDNLKQYMIESLKDGWVIQAIIQAVVYKNIFSKLKK